jgi:hypothetical protein
MILKKIFLLFIPAILSITLARAQSDWISYKIDNKLSVKVPTQPTQADEYTVISQSKDSVIFVIALIDLQKVSGIDSTALAGLAPTDEFTSEIKNGMAGKMHGYILGDIKTSRWKGYYCYNIDGTNADKKLKTYTFMVAIGHSIYSLTAVLPDNKDPKVKDNFFASLALN